MSFTTLHAVQRRVTPASRPAETSRLIGPAALRLYVEITPGVISTSPDGRASYRSMDKLRHIEIYGLPPWVRSLSKICLEFWTEATGMQSPWIYHQYPTLEYREDIKKWRTTEASYRPFTEDHLLGSMMGHESHGCFVYSDVPPPKGSG